MNIDKVRESLNLVHAKMLRDGQAYAREVGNVLELLDAAPSAGEAQERDLLREAQAAYLAKYGVKGAGMQMFREGYVAALSAPIGEVVGQRAAERQVVDSIISKLDVMVKGHMKLELTPDERTEVRRALLPKIQFTKEWCERMALLEGDASIGAGEHSKPVSPPAGGGEPVAWQEVWVAVEYVVERHCDTNEDNTLRQQFYDMRAHYATPQAQPEAVPALPPIERDEAMERDYIPLPGGWEMQTKGNGSTFRLCDTKTGQRWIMWENGGQEHKALEQMARDIHAAAPSPSGKGE